MSGTLIASPYRGAAHQCCGYYGHNSPSCEGGKARRPAGDIETDATGKYVLAGLINNHAHVQEERGGIPQPLDYELKIWLACGITTVRDVGSETKKTIALRQRSQNGEVAAPRI